MLLTTTVTSAVLAAAEEDSGNFLVSPSVGLMIWTLLFFGITVLLLSKLAFPKIAEVLDRRQQMIEESIAHAERTRTEAEEILAEYRERLKEARVQAEEIIAKARKTGEEFERESMDEVKNKREQLLEQTRRDIEGETRRALQEIRNEVANLTILATEQVTRKTLSDEEGQRLVQEALSELDFDALAASGG